MKRLVKINRRTGKKAFINIPTWDDIFVENAKTIQNEAPDTSAELSSNWIGGGSGQYQCDFLAFSGSFPNSPINIPYTMGGVVAISGSAPYVYTIISGSNLPTGLSFVNGPSGVTITGTPTQSGSTNFTIFVTDVNVCDAYANYTLNICGNILIYINDSIATRVDAITTCNGSNGYYYFANHYPDSPLSLVTCCNGLNAMAVGATYTNWSDVAMLAGFGFMPYAVDLSYQPTGSFVIGAKLFYYSWRAYSETPYSPATPWGPGGTNFGSNNYDIIRIY